MTVENINLDDPNKPFSIIERAYSCPVQNTDRHLWRKSDEPYSPSIHVTKEGSIGINVGGHVHVMPVEQWHALALLKATIEGAIVMFKK